MLCLYIYTKKQEIARKGRSVCAGGQPLWTWKVDENIDNSDIGQLLYYLTAAHLKTIQQLPEVVEPVREEMEQLPPEILGVLMEGGMVSESSLGD